MEYPIKVKNVCIPQITREHYKYIVVHESENKQTGETEYLFYNFTNDLYSASMSIREIENGVVLELGNVVSL